MKEQSRIFRKTMSIVEQRIWSELRNRRLDGYKFVREFVIPPYIADFVCRAKKIIVEIDGSQHEEEHAIKHDQQRTEYLEKLGYRVIRFKSTEVLCDMNAVLYALKKIMQTSPPN